MSQTISPLAGSNAHAIIAGRRTRVGRGGVMFVLVTVLFAIGAINGQNNLLYFLFGVGIASLLVGGIIGGTAMMGLRVTRTRVTPAHAGEPFRVHYRITNRGRWLPIFGLVIEEQIEAQDERSRVMSSSVRAIPTNPIRAFVAQVPARATIDAQAVVTTTSRGRLTLTRFSVVTSFPFGLLEKRVDFEQWAEVHVLPAPIQLRPGLVQVPQSATAASVETTHRVGAGSEFLATREYTPGDPIRSIAWRQSARTGSPVVRMTADEAGAHVRVILNPRLTPPARTSPGRTQDASDELEQHRLASIASAVISQLSIQGRTVEIFSGAQAMLIAPTPDARHRAQELLAITSFQPPDLGRSLRECPFIVIGVPMPSEFSGPARTLRADEIETYIQSGFSLPDVLDPAWHRERAVSARPRDWRRFLPTLGVRNAAADPEPSRRTMTTDPEPAT